MNRKRIKSLNRRVVRSERIGYPAEWTSAERLFAFNVQTYQGKRGLPRWMVRVASLVRWTFAAIGLALTVLVVGAHLYG